MFPTSARDRDPQHQVSSAVLGVFQRHVIYECQRSQEKNIFLGNTLPPIPWTVLPPKFPTKYFNMP